MFRTAIVAVEAHALRIYRRHDGFGLHDRRFLIGKTKDSMP